MSIPVNTKGFARLEFDEIKKIAAITGFDIKTHIPKKRSCACGPGNDYLMQDKRFYTLLLIKHIELMETQSEKIVPEVANWLGRAQTAAREYAEIERKMHSLPERKTE